MLRLIARFFDYSDTLLAHFEANLHTPHLPHKHKIQPRISGLDLATKSLYFVNGAPRRIRTSGLLIRSHLEVSHLSRCINAI